MAVKDILNKVATGGYDALSDSEYDELKKYPDHKTLFNKVATGGYDALSDSEYEGLKSLSSPAPSTYQFQPGQREDLMANLHEVGYSGLDDTQKALYKQQYDASDYAKAGHSFQEAIDLADRSAKNYSPDYQKQSAADQELANQRAQQYGNEGGNAYTLGRDVLSTLVGAGMSTAEYAKDRLFGEGGWAADKKPWTEYYKESLELGNKGEGATGLIAAPENYIPMGRLGVGGTSLTQGLVGGGTHYLTNENPTLSGTAIASGIGGALGALTKGILGAPERRLGEKATEIENLGLKYKNAQDEYTQLQQASKDISEQIAGKTLTNTKYLDPLAKEAYESVKTKLTSEIDLTRSPWLSSLVEHTAGNRAGALQLDSRINEIIKSQLAEKEAENALTRVVQAEDLLNERRIRPLYNEKDPGMLGWVVKEGEKVPYFGGAVGPIAKKLVFGLSNRAEPMYPLLRAVGDIAVQPTTKVIDRNYNK